MESTESDLYAAFKAAKQRKLDEEKSSDPYAEFKVGKETKRNAERLQVAAMCFGGLACCCLVLCIVACSLGAVVVAVLGSVCLGTHDYSLCGSKGGAIAMVVVGGVLLFGNLCSGRIYCNCRGRASNTN